MPGSSTSTSSHEPGPTFDAAIAPLPDRAVHRSTELHTLLAGRFFTLSPKVL
jgi:hypothetical protein